MRLVKIQRLKVLIRTNRPFFLYAIDPDTVGERHSRIKVRNGETFKEFKKALTKVGVRKYLYCLKYNGDSHFPEGLGKIYPKDFNRLGQFERRYYCVQLETKKLMKIKEDLKNLGWREVRFMKGNNCLIVI